MLFVPFWLLSFPHFEQSWWQGDVGCIYSLYECSKSPPSEFLAQREHMAHLASYFGSGAQPCILQSYQCGRGPGLGHASGVFV